MMQFTHHDLQLLAYCGSLGIALEENDIDPEQYISPKLREFLEKLHTETPENELDELDEKVRGICIALYESYLKQLEESLGL